MKFLRNFIGTSLIGGLLIVLPVYLSILLLAKAAQGVIALLQPVEKLLPASVAHDHLFALLLLMVFCFLVGAVMRTATGRAFRSHVGLPLLRHIPGYDMLRSLAEQLTGRARPGEAWQPAMVHIEDALVPAFVIETHTDGRMTVFVPSVPTPFAGAVYVMTPERVHVLNVPFTQAVRAVSHWGSGCAGLVAAVQPHTPVTTARPSAPM